MTNYMVENMCFPKPNIDDLYKIYEFETRLIEVVLNGEINNALKLYDNFFSQDSMYNIITNDDEISSLKNYIISLAMLISHNAIKKSVSPYSGKAKYMAFSKFIEKSTTKQDVLSLGRDMVRGFATQIVKSINRSIDNISIRKAIDYIHNNLGDDITLEKVAEHVNLSKCYFCTQFKKETKMSFTDYLTYTRIEKSKYLLCNSNKPILDIAVLMGFNSQSYFTTQFKKHAGISPKDFRQRKNNEDYIF